MSITKHIFDSKGSHIVSMALEGESVGIASEEGSVNIKDKSHIVKLNDVEVYPFPIKLEEGVIVQDTDQVPFEGKWYPAEEAQTMKAEREKSNNGKS